MVELAVPAVKEMGRTLVRATRLPKRGVKMVALVVGKYQKLKVQVVLLAMIPS